MTDRLPLDIPGEPHDCYRCEWWKPDPVNRWAAWGTCAEPKIGPMPTAARGGGCRDHFRPLRP